jgi:Heterokaryon incompatibility protein (HET)
MADEYQNILYQYSTFEEQSHYIRLLTLLPGQPQDDIRVNLSEVHLLPSHDPSSPLYECLSYAWGSSNDCIAIYVNSRITIVTKSLGVALVYLRQIEVL